MEGHYWHQGLKVQFLILTNEIKNNECDSVTLSHPVRALMDLCRASD